MNRDVARLEAERLRPPPPEERNPTPVEVYLERVIHVLAVAILEDQRAGKWGKR